MIRSKSTLGASGNCILIGVELNDALDVLLEVSKFGIVFWEWRNNQGIEVAINLLKSVSQELSIAPHKVYTLTCRSTA